MDKKDKGQTQAIQYKKKQRTKTGQTMDKKDKGCMAGVCPLSFLSIVWPVFVLFLFCLLYGLFLFFVFVVHCMACVCPL
jgi:hypothetical protein